MSYSRRQLYAFGEPLGDSVTRKEGGRIVYGGGGGNQSSSGTSTQISELPEWAKGYAKDTLAKAGALTDVNQNPYQAYGANRIAGFSPMQQQAQQQAAGMQTSGLTGLGGQLAGAATMGALGSQYDPTQFQAGQFGGESAQQYMSPYMQNVVDIQQREAQRQGDIAGTQLASQATKSGAFGGGRQAIMQSEAARNLATQKGDIQARGLQSSYEQAQNQFNADQARRMQAQQLSEQSKQYGAGYGMQGLQTALQGAGQMGTLGGQQFAQGMDINKLQSAYGGQQQALEQQGLSQAYQDFQNQQNYPYKQLGFMSDMIRGLPLGQQSTSQMYEAQPGMAQQLGSLGMGAYGLSKFMAEGGMAYAGGGGVDSAENVADIVGSLSPQQLAKSLEAAQARGDTEQVRAIQDEMGFQASLKNGLASTVTPDMAQRMAGGGVVAFAKGGAPSISDALTRMREAANYTAPTSGETLSGIKAQMPGLQGLYGESKTAPYVEEVKADRAALKANQPEDEAAPWLAAAEGMLKGRGILAGLTNALPAFGKEVRKIKKENREADRLLRASEIQLATADQARADGMVGKATELEKDAQTKAQKAAEMKTNVAEKELTIAATIRGQDVQASATAGKKTFEQEAVEAKLNAALAADPSIAKDPAKLAAAKTKAYSDTAKETRPASSIPEKIQSAEDIAKNKINAVALEKAKEAVDTARFADPVWRAAKAANNPAAMERREKEMIAQRLPSAAAPQAAPAAPVAVPPQAVDILKKNPSQQNIEYFDKTFGPGAAARALGK
jgi:hypothetical protein